MPSQTLVTVEVMYPYSAAECNQISLVPGERIRVLEKDKSGWWIGQRTTGEMGIFPSTYVRVVEDRLKFNRPKELKQLPLSGDGGKASGGKGGDETEKKWRAQLGLDDESGGEGSASPDGKHGGDGASAAEVAKLRRSIDSLTSENAKLHNLAAQLENEKDKMASEAAAIRTQLPVLKRQLASAHEKERRILLELEDWKILASENGATPPPQREYKDEPDEALSRWLDIATQDKVKDAEREIADLKKQLEKKRVEAEDWKMKAEDESRYERKEPSDFDSEGDEPPDLSYAESAPPKKPDLRSSKKGGMGSVDASPDASMMDETSASDRVVGGRPDKHDVVRLADDFVDDGGEGLKHGEVGVVVEDQGEESPMPFRVKNTTRQSGDCWYTEHDLVIVTKGKRGKKEPAGGSRAASPNDESSKQFEEEIKDKTKKIKKLEKKQQLLEEDFKALEEYNGKLEKKLEKEKEKLAKEKAKTKAILESGEGGDGAHSAALQQEIQDLRDQVAQLKVGGKDGKKKSKKSKDEDAGAEADDAGTPGTPSLPAAPPPMPGSGGGGGGVDPVVLEKLQSEHDELTAVLEKAELENATFKEQIDALKNEGGAQVEELLTLKEKSAGLEAAIAEHQAELEASREEERDLRDKLSATNEDLAGARAEYEAMLEKFNAATTRAEAAEEKAEKAAARCDEIEADMAKWGAERDKIVGELEEKSKRCIQMDEDLKYANARYKKEEGRRRDLYNKLMELKGNIRVYCRIKPCPDDPADCVGLEDDMTVRVKDPQTGKVTPYEFDKCFDQPAQQEDVFEEAKGLATSVLDGFYVCIFAYGQTGSGKTYTMEGPPENRGVNFRTVSELFRISQERSSEYAYKLSVSVLEVYNDKVYDLQGNRTLVKINPPPKGERDIVIQPLVKTEVTSADQVVEALEAAYSCRKIAGTSMNAHSSRSHCVLTVWLEIKNLSTGMSMNGKLHLIDLAGSERIAKSEVTGEQKTEAVHINKSLTQLGLCINSLANKKDHIPYRNSQLTTLLQDSLGGNCKCLMFANISPLTSNVPETVSTLTFATNAKKVELGKATRNVK